MSISSTFPSIVRCMSGLDSPTDWTKELSSPVAGWFRGFLPLPPRGDLVHWSWAIVKFLKKVMSGYCFIFVFEGIDGVFLVMADLRLHDSFSLDVGSPPHIDFSMGYLSRLKESCRTKRRLEFELWICPAYSRSLSSYRRASFSMRQSGFVDLHADSRTYFCRLVVWMPSAIRIV